MNRPLVWRQSGWAGLPAVSGAVLVLAALLAPAGVWSQVEVRLPDGDLLVSFDADPGQEWCLRWNHSVTGGAVADCFANHGGQMLLTRSYLHDFAAGLGHLPDRGRLRSAEGGGYWIEAMDEPVRDNTLPLRVGAPQVGHRLVTPDGSEIDLSAAAAGTRVTIRLLPPQPAL